MDPYKLLGISPNQVKQPSDVDKVRHRAKTLFKRLKSEGKKFDAKKVLEAFEIVKQNQKGKVGEGQYKLLGRSRKERELDKHFNHQSKEIKKNKKLKKELRKASHGTGKERFHLPGDKERIPKHRRRHHRRRRKMTKEEKQKQVNILEGLNRLAVFLPKESKFPKGIKLLHRWTKDYMNADNREYLFKVLDTVADLDFITNDAEARQDVILVFEYVLGFFSEWFGKEKQQELFGKMWRVASVLACQCFTDDAFVLSTTISKLKEALALLEAHREEIGVVITPEAKRAKREELKQEAEAKREKEEEALKQEAKEEVEEEDESPDWGEETKVEVKDEKKAKTEPEAKGSKKAQALPFRGMAPVVEPAPKQSPTVAVGVVDDKDDGAPEVLSSEDEMVDVGSDESVHGVGDSDDDSVDGIKDEVDIGSSEASNASDGEQSSEGEAEFLQGSIYPTPQVGASLERLREFYVQRCLATLFNQRGPLWARPKIDAFFQELFYRRAVFSEAQQLQIEGWQSRIKTNQRLGERLVGEANNPMEAQRPVVDSRETLVNFDADAGSWAAKQTFDSRESAAQRVIR